MPETLTKRSAKAGLPPGTLVHVGVKPDQPTKLTLMEYDEEKFSEHEVASVEECLPFLEAPTVTWLNVAGIHQVEVIEQLGHLLNLHPLLLEDVVNTSQRPKLEDYQENLFIVLKMLEYDGEAGEVVVEQVSLVLGKTYLVSFQEDDSDVFAAVRTRLRAGTGRLRKSGPDYLAYALIDAIVDNYFAILEQVGEEVEEAEDGVATRTGQETLHEIYRLKREMIALRRAVWPLREVLGALQRGESGLIQAGTVIYLRDVYDHTIQIIDTIESIRDIAAGMLDIYLSATSNRLNEVMKVLTIFSAIFIPLTFLAGVYGMNFHYLPELSWRWGYALFWLVCGTIAAVLLIYFRRKRWL
jgi:magnesium transporter